MSTLLNRPVLHRPTDDAGAGLRTEPGLTLAEPAPRTLGLIDQVALWGNLGLSLLGPLGALYVLAPIGVPPLSLTAAFTAVVVGTAIGAVLLGLAAVPGAQTGAPAMVLMRGLFGGRLSWLPTALNLAQCLGWATFELVVIAAGARALLPWDVQWPYVLLAGALTTLLALRPLGTVRLLRRYALVAVLVAAVYLGIQLARNPLPAWHQGSWAGFWLAADVVIAVAVSWVPLAADYTRHSRGSRSAFGGAFLGFTLTQVACYTLGLLAFSTVASADGDTQRNLFSGFLAVPFGWLPFAVLVLRELDESFTNVYSTAVSVQNLRPLADRRVLAVAVGSLATVGALILDVSAFQSFLYLLGSVFVPMFAVFAVDYFLLGGRTRWNTAVDAPNRWLMLLPWVAGFVAYQFVNPGSVSAWASFWTSVAGHVGFTPATWMSASIVSFVVAAVLTALIGLVTRGRRP
ncbi:MAG: nucleobase:cation symporter, family [Frankiaceae bacterium]|nr:nucleobase:cation symporter, family [Frankiaceae bacterium]